MTSNGTMAPLQKSDRVVAAVCQQDGFPLVSWDNDMDDELLKLLITKARLFEDQIRYASNGPLVAIEVTVQLTQCPSTPSTHTRGFCVHCMPLICAHQR